MKNNFISKFETKNFLIGSFRPYEEEALKLLEENSYMNEEDATKNLEEIKNYKASILDKNGNYFGFIGLYNVNNQDKSYSIRIETKEELDKEKLKEIKESYIDWISSSINLKNINDEIIEDKDGITIKINDLSHPSVHVHKDSFCLPGVSYNELEKFKTLYNIPNLSLPCSIKAKDKTIGIIGLSNLIWSNRRANLNIFFDKSLGDDIISYLTPEVIDEYLKYAHKSYVHNINLSIPSDDKKLLSLINKTSMSYYGSVPYASSYNGRIDTSVLYESLPHYKKEKGVFVPQYNSKENNLLPERTSLSEIIQIDENTKLVNSKAFEKEGIDFERVVNSHIKAMKNRENFTKPLGEDKYIIEKDSMEQAIKNFSYVILNSSNDYLGYINILRENANGRNAELEIAVTPKAQNKGIGTKTLNAFYDELFKHGYLSATSSVFSFNTPSLKLHDKAASYNGTRIDAYYINGKMWDMSLFSKVNNSVKYR